MNVLSQSLALLGTIALALLSSRLRPVYLIPAYGLLALAALLSWSPRRHAGVSIRVVPALISATVFFGYILCRTVLSPVESLARPDLFMVLACLIVYFLTAICATSPTPRLVFTSALFLLACAQVVRGFINREGAEKAIETCNAAFLIVVGKAQIGSSGAATCTRWPATVPDPWNHQIACLTGYYRWSN